MAQTHPDRNAARRMSNYRQRMRAAGLRPVQVWVPDTRAPAFIAECRRQARALADHDPAREELEAFAQAQDWPEA